MRKQWRGNANKGKVFFTQSEMINDNSLLSRLTKFRKTGTFKRLAVLANNIGEKCEWGVID